MCRLACCVFQGLSKGGSVVPEVIELVLVPLLVVWRVLHVACNDADQTLIGWLESLQPPLLLIKLRCLQRHEQPMAVDA